MKIYKITNHEKSVNDLEGLAKSTTNGRHKIRLTVIAHILRDPSIRSKSLCRMFLIQKGTISKWLKKYNQGGIDELLDINLGGRPEGNPKWDKNIFQSLFDELDKQEEYWSVPKMQSWIEKHHDATIPLSTIEYHLKNSNYSYKSNRPSPYKGDRDAQGRFKKKE